MSGIVHDKTIDLYDLADLALGALRNQDFTVGAERDQAQQTLASIRGLLTSFGRPPESDTDIIADLLHFAREEQLIVAEDVLESYLVQRMRIPSYATVKLDLDAAKRAHRKVELDGVVYYWCG